MVKAMGMMKRVTKVGMRKAMKTQRLGKPKKKVPMKNIAIVMRAPKKKPMKRSPMRRSVALTAAAAQPPLAGPEKKIVSPMRKIVPTRVTSMKKTVNAGNKIKSMKVNKTNDSSAGSVSSMGSTMISGPATGPDAANAIPLRFVEAAARSGAILNSLTVEKQ